MKKWAAAMKHADGVPEPYVLFDGILEQPSCRASPCLTLWPPLPTNSMDERLTTSAVFTDIVLSSKM